MFVDYDQETRRLLDQLQADLQASPLQVVELILRGDSDDDDTGPYASIASRLSPELFKELLETLQPRIHLLTPDERNRLILMAARWGGQAEERVISPLLALLDGARMV